MKLTEAKLKQLIKEVLNEGAKSITDLPDGVYVSVYKSPSKRKFEIKYVDRHGSDPFTWFGLFGMVAIGDPLFRHQDLPCSDAYAIEISRAAQGWGPLLYDVAMEVATLTGGGLTPDRAIVSNEAYDVWDYYLKNRSDVQVSQLDNENSEITPDLKADDCSQGSTMNHVERNGGEWNDSPLSKIYTKEPTTLRALGDKLRVVGTSLTF